MRLFATKGPSVPDHRSPLTQELWSAAAPIYGAILEHPFLTELTTGELPRATFRAYLVQDVHYIGQFARVLGTLAGRAPERRDTAMLTRRAGELAAEHALHEHLMAELGVDEALVAATPLAPTALGYVNFLLATAYGGAYSDALAALLACPWIYWEVGQKLIAEGSPDPLYQDWIERYGGPVAAVNVPPFLELVDRVGAGLSDDARHSAVAHFVTGCRYEWMFWDMAYRREEWPV